MAAFYDILDKRLGGTSDPLLPASKEISAARQAGTALYHYAVAAAGHDDAAAARRYETDVRALVPEVVALGDHESEDNRRNPRINRPWQRFAGSRKCSVSNLKRCSGALANYQRHKKLPTIGHRNRGIRSVKAINMH